MKSLIRRVVKRGLEFAGIDAFARKDAHHYVPTLYGTTAHKHIDIRTVPIFGELAAATIATGRTLLSYDRLYTIFQALTNIHRTQPDSTLNAVEIGVYRGGTSHFIANAAAALGFDSLTLHCFDTFEGHSPADLAHGRDGEHRPGDFHDTSLEAVRAFLSPYDGIHFHRGRIQDTGDKMSRLPIHFAHLDVDLYEPILFALELVSNQLAPDGWMVVDDYGYRTCPGVAKAVDEFLAKRPSFFAIHLLTGQCVILPQGTR